MQNNIPDLGNFSEKSKIVVLTGAGVSAESGISTFRDNGGLWEKYNIYEVATPEAWHANRKLVLEFYNQRRKQLLEVRPNEAHEAIARLQDYFDVHVITQNIDDLHERAGSKKVLHLHGELKKAQSSVNPGLVYAIEGWELREGDCCEQGSQLRPHVVWFGEAVPMIEPARKLVSESDLLIVVGTSLTVYPAAGLLYAVRPWVPVVAIDPSEPELTSFSGMHHIKEKAGTGVKKLVAKLLRGE